MNAVEMSLNMEKDAVAFYTEAAGKTSHPVGKKMFLSIAEDEKRHIEMLTALLKGLDLTPQSVDPMAKVKSVFEEMKDEMHARITATSDDTKALEIAMEMERKGFEFYKKAASEAPDPKSRGLFERLITEEERHYQIFLNTHEFLTDTGNWFMWEERGIVEG
jgi:rubrerythrin